MFKKVLTLAASTMIIFGFAFATPQFSQTVEAHAMCYTVYFEKSDGLWESLTFDNYGEAVETVRILETFGISYSFDSSTGACD